MTQIVQVNVSQQIPPTPSTLQRTGALLSQGGTLTAPGTKSLLTQLADLTAILAGALPVSSITRASNVATVTTTLPHGYTISDTLLVTIAGATLAAYNGTFLVTVTGASTFTYTVIGTPATPAVGTIVYTDADVAELLSMATTFFSQGTAASVYVLELGPGNATDGATYLGSWIQLNQNFFYSYLVPREWDNNPAFLALAATFQNTTAKTYFFVTTTLSTYTAYTALMKSILTLVETPAYGVWPSDPLTALSYAGAWPANVITNIVGTPGGLGQVFTATTTTSHGVLPGQTFSLSGVTPSNFNTSWVAIAGTTGSTLVFTAALYIGPTIFGQLNASAGGSVTGTTVNPHGVQVGQWFTLAGAVPTAYNGTWQAIAGTTGSTLVFAVPSPLPAATIYGTLLASTYSSTGIPATEFSMAAAFYVALNYNPSSTNKVTPFNLSFLFGVTPYPTQGNSVVLQLLQNANVSVVGTGAAGGISGAVLVGGNTSDGNPFNYWYSVDWMQINIVLNVTNAVINGSNNPANPLYLDQDGINSLQAVGAGTAQSAVTFGLALGSVSQTELNGRDFAAALAAGTFAGNVDVNAVPFVDYYHASPGDYKIGKYAGFTIVYTPQRGFSLIVFNIIVTQFVAP